VTSLPHALAGTSRGNRGAAEANERRASAIADERRSSWCETAPVGSVDPCGRPTTRDLRRSRAAANGWPAAARGWSTVLLKVKRAGRSAALGIGPTPWKRQCQAGDGESRGPRRGPDSFSLRPWSGSVTPMCNPPIPSSSGGIRRSSRRSNLVARGATDDKGQSYAHVKGVVATLARARRAADQRQNSPL
jgi:hypothetical protein